MDKEHLKGAADKAKGAVKDTVGKMTGDTKMQAEGKVDKAKGTAHNVAGDLKDAARTRRITTKNATYLTLKGRPRGGLLLPTKSPAPRVAEPRPTPR